MNALQYRLDKTMRTFSANAAFDKTTDGQTDIKTRNVVNTQLNVTFEDRIFHISCLSVRICIVYILTILTFKIAYVYALSLSLTLLQIQF